MSRSGSGRRRQRSASDWQGVVSRFSESGLTVTAFCAGEGISPASFYRWRGILSGGIEAPGSAHNGPTPAFVELGDLGVVGAPAPSATGHLEIRLDLGGGLLLTLVRN